MEVKKGSPVEYPVTLFVNGHELLTIQMTPVDLEDWTVGFLYGEGLITGPDDVIGLHVDPVKGVIQATLKEDVDERREEEKKRYITSGCGKGVTFSSMQDTFFLCPVKSDMIVTQHYLQECMRFMYKGAVIYQETGGMHAAIAAGPDGPLFVREDIGRHNAVDKAIGAALKLGLEPRQTMIMTTGRISYEMISKVARFGGAMVASRTAATDQAVRLAEHLGIEVVGYIRGQMMKVYTAGTRVLQETATAGV